MFSWEKHFDAQVNNTQYSKERCSQKFLVFVGGSLDKPPEGSQKPHLVFLYFPLPPTSFLPPFSNQD
ncbi:hypothetical protein SLEP1_g30098 [Rubroshorea leprosula]|uniref:Uncharacterized protein n=1 Tax=Rubroshorea leprosula TaxID=152421 RepID=A0AAV5K9S5_9ROSI|nr:hypothetical protein SLEP1_g30098 [Rubroshorea leprosula]